MLYARLEGYGQGEDRGWGMEVKKTSGVLASCPLAGESTNRSKDLFPEKERESETHERKRCRIKPKWRNRGIVEE